MDMEVVGETMRCTDQVVMIKGRRTKRQRPSSSYSPASSSSVGGSTSCGVDRSSSIQFGEENTEEEEDMANCLILLAQGKNHNKAQPIQKTITGKDGLYEYECKTCNRCFPSFQALGGHRASHKKPKAAVEEKNEGQLINNITPYLLSPPTGNKAKIHECSICGSEFSSGQALGGHMRRHRAPITQETKKSTSLLALDLNLPAPEEDVHDNKFSFSPLIFSASSLVDCHY